SDAINIKTTARRDGDSYVLNGQKTWISLADYADQFLVIARLASDSSSERGTRNAERGKSAANDMIAFIVERKLKGFSSRPIKGKLGVRAGNTGEIFFEDMRVPADCMLGEEGDGFRVAMSALDHGRYTVASGAVGIIQGCLDACTEYCHSRMVGGEEIGKKQL